MKKTVYIEGSGCNRRQLDLQKIEEYLKLNDYKLVENPETADYIVLGTCAFKKKEEDISVSRLRDLQRHRSKLLVVGCLPDIAPERFQEFGGLNKLAPKEIDEIDGFFPENRIRFKNIPDSHTIAFSKLNLARIKGKLKSGELFTREFLTQTGISGGRRLQSLFKPEKDYYLFICRGCAGKCSYCAIVRSIGTVKSKPHAEILQELRTGVENGYRSFTILGDDPGCYGLDIKSSFPEVLGLMLQESVWIGQSFAGAELSFHVKEIHPKFVVRYEERQLDLLASRQVKSILCPIQSGSDRILELMQREHRADELIEVMSRIKRKNPEGNNLTQIIVGFPSEREEEFRQTLEAVKAANFDSVVVFPYHDKEGTPSSKLAGKIPEKIIKQRMREAFKFFRKEGIKAYYNCP